MSNVPARASRKTRQMSEQRTTERLPDMAQRAPRQERVTEPVTIKVIRRHGRHYWLLSFVVGMVIILVVVGFWQMVVTPITSTLSDQWHYGDGRIARVEARFGHNDQQTPTEILALENQHQIDLIELPGGEVKKARGYQVGEVITQQTEHVVITLNVKDVNGDGLLDVVVSSPESDVASFVLYNNGTTFQTTPPTKGA